MKFLLWWPRLWLLLLAPGFVFLPLMGLTIFSIAGPLKRAEDISNAIAEGDLTRAEEILRVKLGSSSGGHNGLKDIQSAFGTPDYWRLRIGIGHPRSLQLNQGVSDFVLHRPRQDEQIEIDRAIARIAEQSRVLVQGGMTEAQRQLHTHTKP